MHTNATFNLVTFDLILCGLFISSGCQTKNRHRYIYTSESRGIFTYLSLVKISAQCGDECAQCALIRGIIPPTQVVEGEEEEEDPVDPQEVLREKCGATPKCMPYQEKLDTCNERVSSRTKTAETCTEELFDFIHCMDNCVSLLSVYIALPQTLSLIIETASGIVSLPG